MDLNENLIRKLFYSWKNNHSLIIYYRFIWKRTRNRATPIIPVHHFDIFIRSRRCYITSNWKKKYTYLSYNMQIGVFSWFFLDYLFNGSSSGQWAGVAVVPLVGCGTDSSSDWSSAATGSRNRSKGSLLRSRCCPATANQYQLVINLHLFNLNRSNINLEN